MSNVTTKLSKRMKKIAQGLAKKIEQAAGENLGFTLIIYTPGRASYIGNVDRKDGIKGMQHLISEWKKEGIDIPYHEEVSEDKIYHGG